MMKTISKRGVKVKVKTAKVKVTVTKRLLVSDLDMFLEFPCSATVLSLYNSMFGVHRNFIKG